MLSRFRHVFGAALLVVTASCSGSGCTSCGGMTPLPGGFPKAKTIANAASVRISRPGLDFAEQNLGDIAGKIAGAQGGKYLFPIPETTISQDDAIGFVDIEGKVCPGGPNAQATPPKCIAEIDLGSSSFRIDSVKPGSVDVRATILLQVDDTPIDADFNPGPAMTLHVGYGANGRCIGANDELVTVDPYPLPIRITIPLLEETTAPRTGYTKIDVDNAVIDLDAIKGDEVRICADCGILGGTCNSVLNAGFIKNTIVNQIKNQLDTQVKTLLRSQLCTKPTPTANPPCPNGSQPNAAGDTCVYTADQNKCVSMLLGTDSHIELGGFLASISPGSQGALDFGLAAGGAMNPSPGADADGTGRTTNGIGIAMVGGVIPQPPSRCVPDSDKEMPVPTGIPVPDELAPTAADPAGTPHVGIALSGRFLDYSLHSVYRSGLLCLGVSTEQVDMLKSGLLSLIIPSIKALTFEQSDAAAAIATRPQAPPSVTLGGGTDPNKDPLLLVKLPKFAVDFYIWSHDRYVRAFTFQADLTVPINLQTGKNPQTNPKGGIVPAIGDIVVENGTVSNAELLMDDPAMIAAALQGLIGGLSKQLLGGGLSPLDLSTALAALGVDLEVNQIKKLTKGQDDFLGVFATLSKAQGTALAESDTTATLRSKVVDAAHMGLTTYERSALPRLEIAVGSSLEASGRAVEYTWSVDKGTRSPWQRVTGATLVVQDEQLLLQGRHVLHVSSRVVGDAASEDATPADVPFVIDALAPFVTVERDGKAAKVSAWDLVSAPGALLARYRLDDGPMTGWQPLADLATLDVGAAEVVDVEVKDEEGNVRSIQQGLVRGRGDGTLAGASACGCSTPGAADAGSGVAILLAALGFAVVVLRRRGGAHRAFAGPSGALLGVLSLSAVAATSQGCGCGGDAEAANGCGADCRQECSAALSLGMPGSYTSIAKAPDGTLWVAGYNDALLEEADALLFGDLVVGKYDLAKGRVDWTTVDGVPTRDDGSCPEHDRGGFRGGETNSGDNVGLWTSIQVGEGGTPFVSYYDATNKRLKLAFESDGWRSFVLKEAPGADAGRYSKLAIVDGKPVVAYLHMEKGNEGKLRSKVVVARAKVAKPMQASDFAFEDVAVDEDGPCGPTTCSGSDACLKSTGLCTPPTQGCAPVCTDSEACVAVAGKATCVAKMGPTLTYPRGFGAYISLANGPNGLGIVAYDAIRGNLMGFSERSPGSWETLVLDGETGDRKQGTALDTGDVGIAASLQIDDGGVWHVTYVNGIDESLRYLRVTGGKPSPSEVIDDGITVDGAPFPDGRHIVGDDSSVRANGSDIVVYYQDATVGTLRRAQGPKAGATRTWERRVIAQPNRFAGFFPQVVPGEDRVANWWRETSRGTKSVVGDVSIVP